MPHTISYSHMLSILQMELKLVIPGKVSTPLPDGKLAVRDWANLAYDDDTGVYSGLVVQSVTESQSIFSG